MDVSLTVAKLVEGKKFTNLAIKEKVCKHLEAFLLDEQICKKKKVREHLTIEKPALKKVSIDTSINRILSKYRWSLLHEAVMTSSDTERYSNCKALLDKGIDVTLRDSSHQTAEEKAIDEGYNDIVELIRSYS